MPALSSTQQGIFNGTTSVGGASNGGVAFSLAPQSDGDWMESVIRRSFKLLGRSWRECRVASEQLSCFVLRLLVWRQGRLA